MPNSIAVLTPKLTKRPSIDCCPNPLLLSIHHAPAQTTNPLPSLPDHFAGQNLYFPTQQPSQFRGNHFRPDILELSANSLSLILSISTYRSRRIRTHRPAAVRTTSSHGINATRAGSGALARCTRRQRIADRSLP